MQSVPAYDNFERILLLGEADFSFTRAFAQEYSDKNQDNTRTSTIEITATEYGNGTDIANRYHNGNFRGLAQSMNSIQNLAPVKEIMAGLNARLLGDVNNCTCQRWNVAIQEWGIPIPFWHESSTKFDLIIFNFPHSDQAGRAAKLVKAFFKQVRICIMNNRLPPTVVVEMRLRTLESDPKRRKNVRTLYRHEEAAAESQFDLIGCWASDLDRWERAGYEHKWSRRNASCRDISQACKVWRWTPKKCP